MSSRIEAPLERVIAYVDGYNVYYGLKHKGWTRYLWLDYWALIARELTGGQKSVAVKYFTALGRREPTDSTQRHLLYLSALDAFTRWMHFG